LIFSGAGNAEEKGVEKEGRESVIGKKKTPNARQVFDFALL
jgi:hypothetical protein